MVQDLVEARPQALMWLISCDGPPFSQRGQQMSHWTFEADVVAMADCPGRPHRSLLVGVFIMWPLEPSAAYVEISYNGPPVGPLQTG